MVAAEKNNQGMQRTNKLWFSGAGSLGAQLNLGVNTDFVSKNYQEGIYGDEYLLGLVSADSVDLNPKDVTASNATGATAMQRLKYLLQEKARLTAAGATGTWNSQQASELADLLQYVNRVTPAAGVNNQAEVMKDFLAVYSSTLDDGVVGNKIGWDDQVGFIKSGGSDAGNRQIRQMIFGGGTQATSLVDGTKLLIGGLGAHGGGIGAQLTAETLAKIMNSPVSVVADWVDPINKALRDFDINTPKAIAAFLANVRVETKANNQPGGLTALAEDTHWNLNKIKPGRFSNASQSVINQYANTSDDVKADYAYASETSVLSGTLDGRQWKGRGLLHLTWKNNYRDASMGLNAIYGAGTYDLVNNYASVATDSQLAARTGAWYWRNGSNARDLNDVIYRNGLADAENFRRSVGGINGGFENISRDGVWVNVKSTVYDENAYGNLGTFLKALGISTENSAGYNTKFGFTLNARQPVNIPVARHLEAIAQPEPEPDVAAAQAALLTLQNEFEVRPEEVDMLMDVPTMPPANTVIVVDAKTLRIATKGVYGTVGVCYLSATADQLKALSDLGGDRFALSIRGMAGNIFSQGRMQPPTRELPDYDTAPIKLLLTPEHGRLTKMQDGDFYYTPNSKFTGNDRAEFEVDFGTGYKVKVVYFIKVNAKFDWTKNPPSHDRYCPPDGWWRISYAEPSTPFGANQAAAGQSKFDAASVVYTVDGQRLSASIGTDFVNGVSAARLWEACCPN